MLKKILLTIAISFFAAASMAAVDVNKATAAELDGIKGIGPGLSGRILGERQSNGHFKDWNDFIQRVSGVGEKTATRFSNEGLTVNGKAFGAASSAKDQAQGQKESKAESAAKASPGKDARPAPAAKAASSAASKS